MKVGYARVSSLIGQETGLETQVQILKDFGCEKIFSSFLISGWTLNQGASPSYSRHSLGAHPRKV